MRIAIVHYHLKRGGVTRVIESTLHGFESLNNPPQSVVLAGEVPGNFRYKENAHTIEGLHYSNTQPKTPDSKTLLERMRTAASDALGGEPDIWHIHNHSLGKNSAMPGVVALLAEGGESVLLHMHDFAEDGRPENFRLNQERHAYAADLYPNISKIHYGVLNARDYEIFKDTGLGEARLHLLANPVEAHAATESHDSALILNTLGAQRIFLYPVRAVRRKNFGEMLLWAALAEEGDVFATTLGPTNQNYATAYERWQTFAATHQLPVHFGVGERYNWSFEAIMQSAEAILSTSIAEGFGLAFLEPWLFGKAIIGRDLPDITADFKANGIQLNRLYTHIPIPTDWIDLSALEDALHDGLATAYAAYECPLPKDAVERALEAITPTAGTIDFAGLNEPLQETVIERVVKDVKARDTLPRLISNIKTPTIQQNASIIDKDYSLSQYAEKLVQIYTDIQAGDRTDSTQYINPSKALNGFLKPERFRLLRT